MGTQNNRLNETVLLSTHNICLYIVGTQNNHLNEMVLLSTHNICFG